MKFEPSYSENTRVEANKFTDEVIGTQNNISLVKADHERALSETSNHIMSQREQLKKAMISSGEAQRISDSLSVNDLQTLVVFGKQASESIGQCADAILRKQSSTNINEVGTMMGTLTKIMDKVDIKELDEPIREPGFFEKIFNKAQGKIEALISKYNNIGNDIEQVCVQLRVYEAEIAKSNDDLEALYNNGIAAYKELTKYVIAGELALEEIAAYKANFEKAAQSDEQAALQLSNIEQAEQLLSQRVQDLRMAESVALQSLPIVKSMQYGNLNLSRKINSAFIITIPVFKNAMAQAIIAKRQFIQAKALQALDDKTNEMLLRNAQNAANNMKLSAKLAGSSSIKVETIQQSWQTIMDGIRDTKAIQDELVRQRESDKNMIESINSKYLAEVKGI